MYLGLSDQPPSDRVEHPDDLGDAGRTLRPGDEAGGHCAGPGVRVSPTLLVRDGIGTCALELVPIV